MYSNFRSRNPLSHNIDFGHDCLIRIHVFLPKKINNKDHLYRKDMTKSPNDATVKKFKLFYFIAFIVLAEKNSWMVFFCYYLRLFKCTVINTTSMRYVFKLLSVPILVFGTQLLVMFELCSII